MTLPVTTQVSVAGGREVWGFPKYLAEMQSDFSDPKRASFALEGEFEASLAQGFTVPTPGLPFLTYTEQPTADITRTKIRVGHTFRWGGALELTVHGDGPTADVSASAQNHTVANSPNRKTSLIELRTGDQEARP